jgi:predicted MFS family arabinose efflux permease
MEVPVAEEIDEGSAGPQGATGITLRQYAILVAAGAFATTFAQQQVLARYPTTFLLKEHMHLARTDVAVFMFWATFAWNLKPLAGVLTDAFPLLGTRRRSYMVLGSLAAGVLWLVMGLFPNNYNMLLLAAVGMNIATVVASTVMGGLMVEAGQAFRAPGRISSLRQAVQSVAGIFAPLLGGYLAGKSFGWSATTTIGAMTVFLLAVVTFVTLRERRAVRPAPVNEAERVRPTVPPGAWIGVAAGAAAAAYLFRMSEDTKQIGIALFALLGIFVLIIVITLLPTQNAVLAKAQGQLSQILRSRTLWLAAIMLFFVYIVPGFGTPLTYRQSDQLHFSKTYIGSLAMLEGFTGVGAAFIYVLLCRRFILRWMIVGAIILNAAFTLLYLYYTRGTAPWIHSVGGFVGVLSELALMDLAVRSTPKGCEALGFSLMMSVRNFGVGMSDVLGSKLMDNYHFTFNRLVWVNAGTTAAVLLFVFILPKAIVGRKEGSDEQPPPVPTPSRPTAEM